MRPVQTSETSHNYNLITNVHSKHKKHNNKTSNYQHFIITPAPVIHDHYSDSEDCYSIGCKLNPELGMLISFFSKNRLSFWKNRFFFSIIEFGRRYAAGYCVTHRTPRSTHRVIATISHRHSCRSVGALQCEFKLMV